MGNAAKGSVRGRSCAVYQRRRPEKSALHRVVRENLLTFYEEVQRDSAHGFGLPAYVKEEFEGYIRCGLLQHGFARIKCKSPECGYEHVVAYSCKGRAICPSCVGRRMADVAAHLTEHVLPDVPYRQWTLSFPKHIRYRLAHNSALLSQVLGAFHRTVFSWQKRRAKRCGVANPIPGAVCYIQRFGSLLQLNIHLHCWFADGVS